MRRLAGITGACAALLAATAAIALGAGPATITNDPASNTFSPTSYNHEAGTLATYRFTGGSPHDVTATANGPDGKALFRSATISSGSTPVNGTQFLGPGSYPFFCTVHGPSMSGTLVVAGTPQARPSVALQVLDKSLAKVIKKKQLRVQVTTTGTGKAPVSAFLGKKQVATAGEVTAPGTKVLKLPLTTKGRNAIKKKTKVTLTVKSSIAFGSPVKATAKLK
jgi:plastocyanin